MLKLVDLNSASFLTVLSRFLRFLFLLVCFCFLSSLWSYQVNTALGDSHLLPAFQSTEGCDIAIVDHKYLHLEIVLFP